MGADYFLVIGVTTPIANSFLQILNTVGSMDFPTAMFHLSCLVIEILETLFMIGFPPVSLPKASSMRSIFLVKYIGRK